MAALCTSAYKTVEDLERVTAYMRQHYKAVKLTIENLKDFIEKDQPEKNVMMCVQEYALAVQDFETKSKNCSMFAATFADYTNELQSLLFLLIGVWRAESGGSEPVPGGNHFCRECAPV